MGAGKSHGSLAGASPDTRRSLAVVPLIPDQRYCGEAPARLRWGYGGMSGRQGTIFHPFLRKQRKIPVTWIQRYNLRHYLRNSVWILPPFGLVAGRVLGSQSDT